MKKGDIVQFATKWLLILQKLQEKRLLHTWRIQRKTRVANFFQNKFTVPKKTTAKLTKIAASILAITGINDTLHSQNDFTLKGEMILEPIEINASNQTSKILSGQINDPNLNPIQNAKNIGV